MPVPDHFFRHRLGTRRVNDEVGDQVAQVESVVEPVSECAKVGLGVLAVLQRLEGARHHGLEVAQHGVDPLELGQVPGLECAHHPGHVDAPGFGDCSEAPQAVAGDDGLGQQAGLGPLGNSIRREATDHVELEPDGLSDVVHRDGRHEGDLVFRTSPGLAPRAFPTEVGVIELHRTAEQASSFLARHGAVDLVVQQPGGGIAHAQVSLESQGRDAGLGLTDEVDGQKPGRQRQLGVLHQGASGQRGLKAAAAALVELAGALRHKIVLRAGAVRAAKPLRPTRALERLGALRFGAEMAQKLRDRHTVLKLDLVAGHQDSPSSGELRLRSQWLTGRAC